MIQSVLQETLDLARQGDGNNASSIHDIRVNLKKLRAWIRLPETTSPATKSTRLLDDRFKGAGKLLSLSRDQHVLIKTLEWLEKRAKHKRDIDNLERYKACLQQKITHEPVKWRDIIDMLELAQSDMGNHEWPGHLDDNVIASLEQSSRRIRKLGKAVLRTQDDYEGLHKLRRLVKRFTYQLVLFPCFTDAKHRKLMAQLAALGQSLGRIHDLAVLREAVESTGLVQEGPDVGHITRLIDKHSHKLQAKAKQDFSAVFRKKLVSSLRN